MVVRNGDAIEYAVRVSNNAALACDVTDASFALTLPAADGTAAGQIATWGPAASFPAGLQLFTYATAPHTVAVNANVPTITAALAGTFVMHDSPAHSTGTVTKTTITPVTWPTLTLTAPATPSSGIVPVAVSYDYVLTNTSTTPVPMTNAGVNGGGCTPLVRGAGDTNADGVLDNAEAWHYSCSRTYATPGTYGGTASASALSSVDGRSVIATAPATSVTGSAPPRPRLTLTKTATPASGVVPFTATYGYEVYNDSDATAYPVSDVTISDPGCSPVVPASVDALLSLHERWTYTCSLAFTTATEVFSTAVAAGTDTYDGQRISSGEAGAGVTAEATPPPQVPATVRPDEDATPTATATPTPRPTSRASKRVVFPVVSARFPRPCGGRIALTLKAGRTVVARKTVKPDRNCRYRVRFDVLRSRLSGARTVTITARLGKKTITQRLATPA